MTLRVLLVDDHPVYRDGMGLLLSAYDDIEVAGAATTGQEAIAAVASAGPPPDVVVMDIQMPGLNGIEATRRIVADFPDVAVLVLTMYEDDESVFAAMRAGARGYTLKGADGEEIVHAVRAVGRGEAIFGPALARRIGAFFAATPRGPTEVAFPSLTPRETEVLSLVASGLSNNAIAGRLFLSHKTVRNHISAIFTKLQVADRAEAIVKARRQGLGLEPGEPG